MGTKREGRACRVRSHSFKHYSVFCEAVGRSVCSAVETRGGSFDRAYMNSLIGEAAILEKRYDTASPMRSSRRCFGGSESLRPLREKANSTHSSSV